MEQLKQKQADFSSLAKKLQDFIKTAPKERLRIRKKGNNYQYYIEKNKKRTYIPKKNLETARKLAQRDYYQKLLPGLLKNLKAMNQFFKDYSPDNLEQSFSNLPAARKQLVTPIFLDNETYAQQWQAKTMSEKKMPQMEASLL
ncbi:MAG: hypothetical protein J5710_14760 [Treponema sp.]|nr:hypothetical protein [Treponema sp.]